MKNATKYSRRAILASLGLGPALLPILSTDARGGCLANPPKRAIFVVWTNGYQEWVTGSGASYELPGYMKALEPHKADIIPIKGVRYQNLKDTPNPQKADSAGHGATPAILTGRRYKDLRPFVEAAGGPSLDSFIGAELAKTGVKTPRASVNLGVLCDGLYLATWREAGVAARPQQDPYAAFDDLFAGAAAVGADPLIAKVRAAKKSVYDLALRDLGAFKLRVGKENQARIEAHMESVRELEKNLTAPTESAKGCAVPSLGTKIDHKTTRNFHLITKLQMDIAVAALAADVTRSVAIQLSNENGNSLVFTWLFDTNKTDGGLDNPYSHHGAAHKGGDNKRKVDAWFHEQFAYLIKRLKDEKEGAGSMLDNTVALFANHMANGGGHQVDNVPWILAGRCGGHFKTGQAVNVNNVMHTAVLKEMAVAMGVNPMGFFEAQYDADLPVLRGKA